MRSLNFDSLVKNNHEPRQRCICFQFLNYLCDWCLYCRSFCEQFSSGDIHCSSKSNNAFWSCVHSYWDYLVRANSDRSLPLRSNDFLNSSIRHIQLFRCSLCLLSIPSLHVYVVNWVIGVRKHLLLCHWNAANRSFQFNNFHTFSGLNELLNVKWKLESSRGPHGKSCWYVAFTLYRHHCYSLLLDLCGQPLSSNKFDLDVATKNHGKQGWSAQH